MNLLRIKRKYQGIYKKSWATERKNIQEILQKPRTSPDLSANKTTFPVTFVPGVKQNGTRGANHCAHEAR
jgi:hypothetical protein